MPFFGSLAGFSVRVVGALVVGPLSNSGSNDVFVVKYDSSGTPLWARRLGGTGGDITYSVSTDSSGNIVVAGYYTSSPLNIFAENGSTVLFTLANSGANDSFVVKYNSGGTPLWARRIAGTSNDIANSVSVDSSGNIVVAGYYGVDSVNIIAADGSTVSFTLANSGGTDAYIVKYDPNGTPLWARRIGGSGNGSVWSVNTDSSGNIVVAGFYSSTLNIFATNGSTVSFTLANSGSNDTFIVKYDSSGTPLWARRLGGTGDDIFESSSTDSSGNIIVTGNYRSNPLNIYAADGSTVLFTLAISSQFNDDSFVVKYDSGGTPLWARRMGGTLTDAARSVSTDSSGNIVVTGYYNSNPLNIYAVDGSTVSFTLANSGSYDSFVVKYDSSGTPLWARRIGGSGNDQAWSVITDSSGNIVVAGLYVPNPLNIFAANGSTVLFTLANSGTTDVFVVKYDSSGTPLWARRMTGTGQNEAQSVSTDSSGNIVVVGYYTSNPLVIS